MLDKVAFGMFIVRSFIHMDEVLICVVAILRASFNSAKASYL